MRPEITAPLVFQSARFVEANSEWRLANSRYPDPPLAASPSARLDSGRDGESSKFVDSPGDEISGKSILEDGVSGAEPSGRSHGGGVV